MSRSTTAQTTCRGSGPSDKAVHAPVERLSRCVGTAVLSWAVQRRRRQSVIPAIGGQGRGPLLGRSAPPRNAHPVHHGERRLRFMDVGPRHGHRQRQPIPSVSMWVVLPCPFGPLLAGTKLPPRKACAQSSFASAAYTSSF